MTGYEFGDVVLVPFPFSDLATVKKRPAVVVSSSLYDARRPDLIILAITSQSGVAPGALEVAVAGWQQTGLLKPSVLKPVLATVEKRLVLRRLGRLTDTDSQALRQMLSRMLG